MSRNILGCSGFKNNFYFNIVLNVELLSDFYYNFPRELDLKFFNNLSKDEIEKFAKDPKIKNILNYKKEKIYWKML